MDLNQSLRVSSQELLSPVTKDNYLIYRRVAPWVLQGATHSTFFGLGLYVYHNPGFLCIEGRLLGWEGHCASSSSKSHSIITLISKPV